MSKCCINFVIFQVTVITIICLFYWDFKKGFFTIRPYVHLPKTFPMTMNQLINPALSQSPPPVLNQTDLEEHFNSPFGSLSSVSSEALSQLPSPAASHSLLGESEELHSAELPSLVSTEILSQQPPDV